MSQIENDNHLDDYETNDFTLKGENDRQPFLETTNDNFNLTNFSSIDKIKQERRRDQKFNFIICTTVLTTCMVMIILTMLVIAASYIKPAAAKVQQDINQFSQIDFNQLRESLSDLSSIVEKMPDLFKTVDKFKQVNVSDWDAQINSINAINRHLGDYDKSIEDIMEYLEKFSKILDKFNIGGYTGLNLGVFHQVE